MRKIIMVTLGEFSIKDSKDEISKVAAELSEYLNYYPVKSRSSKHGLMGPIGKIITMAKNKSYSGEILKAKALRMHEMNSKSGFIPPDAINALEKAVNSLIEIRDKVPAIMLPKVMDMVDDEVYFIKRKEGIQYLENQRLEFVDFIKSKYGTEKGLQEAWSESVTFSELKYPSKKWDYYKKGSETKRSDIDGFWNKNKEKLEEVD